MAKTRGGERGESAGSPADDAVREEAIETPPVSEAKGEHPSASDDAAAAKERFRDALERKNAAAHRSARGSSNTGTVHGPETVGTSRRVFRRKSG